MADVAYLGHVLTPELSYLNHFDTKIRNTVYSITFLNTKTSKLTPMCHILHHVHTGESKQ